MSEPFVPVENTARFELVFSLDGQVCENVYHVKSPNGWTAESLQEKAGAFVAWWIAHMRTDVSNNVSFNKVLGTDLSSQVGPRVEYVTGLPSIGLNSDGAPLPNHVTVAVKWITGLRGRSYRGRTFHIGLRSTQVDTNTLSSSFATTLTTSYGALITAAEGSGSDRLVVVSRRALNSPRVAGLATEIAAVFVDRTIDSQRRRLPGRGA